MLSSRRIALHEETQQQVVNVTCVPRFLKIERKMLQFLKKRFQRQLVTDCYSKTFVSLAQSVKSVQSDQLSLLSVCSVQFFLVKFTQLSLLS